MKKALLPVSKLSSATKAEIHNDGNNKELLQNILSKYFGYTSFRGKQLEAINAVLAGKDCFCLMPTGGGKSLCYQIPALTKAGIVLVVSPLIALMENQVSDLKSRGIHAEYLSSTQDSKTKEKIYEDINSGKPILRLLYVTPELIATNMFLTKLKKLHSRGLLNLIAIDEAHCISSWGHDFRPSYRKLSILKRYFLGTPMLTLTATAGKKVQEDVIKTLSLHEPVVLLTSFNRPNIFYEVRYKDLLEDPYMDLLKVLKASKQDCAIVYCLARNTCDEIGFRLHSDGISCRVYHAGLSDKVRSQALDDWASGKVPVVVATVAFGMGIDRKDVRIVCHFNIPKSLESFYQESGRAGRDQKPSKSILYYGIDDRRSMAFILSKSQSRKKTESSDDFPTKKAMDDFENVVQYCEGPECRRKKILAHFGEKVASTLCAKSCDACRYPSRLSKELDNLSQFCRTRVNSSIPSVIMNSSYMTGKEWMDTESEFWNYEKEADESEEEISDFDGEASNAAMKVMTDNSVKNAKLDKKLEFLIRAEENYNVKNGINLEKNSGAKNVVPDSFRDASRQRLRIAVQQAFERLGERNLDKDSIVQALESKCFKDYGKTGKSFYNSGIASTVRWLSKSTLAEIQSRTGYHTSSEEKQLIGQKRAFPEDDASDSKQ